MDRERMPSGAEKRLAEPGELQPPLTGPTSAMDRRNGAIFFIGYVLLYLASPVGLCRCCASSPLRQAGGKRDGCRPAPLGLSLASFVPIFFAWIIPPRLERSVVVVANSASAFFAAVVCLVLILPVGNTVRIACRDQAKDWCKACVDRSLPGILVPVWAGERRPQEESEPSS